MANRSSKWEQREAERERDKARRPDLDLSYKSLPPKPKREFIPSETRRQHQPKKPTQRQIGISRSLEKRLGKEKRRWLKSREDATEYIGHMRRELNRRGAQAERERHPDQWSLPPDEASIAHLRRLSDKLGRYFPRPETRREMLDLTQQLEADIAAKRVGRAA